MKNLKRALALALSSIMLVGMMAVGAGAAGFGDADKIEHTDAVNTMVALGVIKGDDKGNFDPERTVTRAEMAKMVCVALNGGTDPNLAGGGLYPDTKGHWAAGYIDYCTNMGIVSGDNHGNFNPDKTVTGTEAAKMMLMAMGYNAQTEKFVNDANWAININVLASTRGLYEDVNGLPDAGLTRDNAAQLIFNGVQAEMVDYRLVGIVGGNGLSQAETNGKTILGEKFDLLTRYGYMTGISYTDAKEEYTYSFSTTAYGDEITEDAINFAPKSTQDFSGLFGMKVKVLYKDNKDKTVYGMYAEGETLFEGVWKDVTVNAAKKTVKFDGVTYDMDKNYATVAFNGAEGAIADHYAVTAIDNDGDNKVDRIVYVPVTVAKVTFVGKESISASANKTTTSYKYEDNDIAEGLAKNDWVLITAGIKSDNTITALEAVTGTVEATRTGEVKIDGTWYKDTTSTTFDLGSEYELIAVNGYIFNAEEKDSAANVADAVYVLKADEVGTGTKEGTQEVRLLFADGSKKIVTVVKLDDKDVKDDADNSKDVIVAEDTIYTYAVDKNGDYKLTSIDANDFDVKSEIEPKNVEIKDGKVTVSGKTYRFADDAVVFVTAGTETKVVSGKVINDWAPYTTSNTSGQNLVYANTKNGFSYVALGKLNLAGETSVPGVAGDKSYGWITGKPYVVKDGDDKKVALTLWNGTAEVTVLVDDASTITDVHAKGTPISYDDLGNDKIENVVSLADKADAVTGYAGGKDIDFLTGNGEINDDTVILYVDTKNNKGIEGGEIAVADEDDMGLTIKNVYAEVKDGKVLFIIVDVNNDLDGVAQGVVANITAAPGETVKVPSAVVAPLTKDELNKPANKDMWGLVGNTMGSHKVAIVDMTMTGVKAGTYYMEMKSDALEIYKTQDERIDQTGGKTRITKSIFNGDKELSVMVECEGQVVINLYEMTEDQANGWTNTYATNAAAISGKTPAYTFTIDASGVKAAN